MPRFTQIDPATATGEAGDLLAQVQKSLGATPNMTKMMANSPALLESYLVLSGALSSGVLPAAVRERLALSTAETNGCMYCLSGYTYIGANIAKVDAQELESARFAKSNDAHTQALLELSNDVLESRGAVRDDTLAQAHAAGVTDARSARSSATSPSTS